MVRYTIQITRDLIIVTDEDGEDMVTVRKNSGADVGTEPRLNFIEGANITLTIVDDAVNSEIDITIAAAGGGGTSWLNQFFPPMNPNDSYGTYNTMKMLDAEDTVIRETFLIPTAIVTIVQAVAIIIPKGAGNFRWQADTNFAATCSNEDYRTHTDTIAVGVTAVDADEVECIDISDALTLAVGDDIVGIEFLRTASNAADTVNADVHFVGILIKGST